MTKKFFSIFLLALVAVSCNSPEPEPNSNSTKAEFRSTPATFSEEGGEGYIEGKLIELSPEGTVVKESPLAKEDFTISLKSGNKDQIELNNSTKTFTIHAGTEEATFVIVAQTVSKETYTQELTIVRKKASTPAVTKKHPLLYVAKYNMAPEGIAFVKSCAPDVSGYFTFDEAVEKFSAVKINGVDYHLPSVEEWLAIVPMSRRESPDYVDFDESADFPDMEEEVVIAGEKFTSLNDYRALSENTTYALRFKGTKMLSAWKYEYTQYDNYPVMAITSRFLEESDANLTIDQICEEAFWDNNKESDVVRYFPASGFAVQSNLRADDPYAFFWSATSPNDPNFAFGMYFDGKNAGIYTGLRNSGRSVRLFETPK